MTGRKIVTRGKTQVAMSIIALSLASAGVNAAKGCKYKDFEGRWIFSEDGTTYKYPFVDGAPFSEVGWARFDEDGQGYAEGFVSVAGSFLPTPGAVKGIPLCNLRIEALDKGTCVATAAFELFDPSTQSWDTRTLTMVLDPDAGEFRYTSSSGDQTVLGTGKKSKGKNWNYTVSETCSLVP